MGLEPKGDWYVSAKAGMLASLRRASEVRAYALSDRPTFLARQSELALEILVEGDSRLHNQYAVIAVNPLRVTGVDYRGALGFAEFLASPAAQRAIGDYGVSKFGQQLFTPNAEVE